MYHLEAGLTGKLKAESIRWNRESQDQADHHDPELEADSVLDLVGKLVCKI